MDTQIDDIVIRDLFMPLGQSILKVLDSKIGTRRRQDWFEIYLATFVIMNNFEFVFADVLEYSTRHGLKVFRIQRLLLLI